MKLTFSSCSICTVSVLKKCKKSEKKETILATNTESFHFEEMFWYEHGHIEI